MNVTYTRCSSGTDTPMMPCEKPLSRPLGKEDQLLRAWAGTEDFNKCTWPLNVPVCVCVYVCLCVCVSI